MASSGEEGSSSQQSPRHRHSPPLPFDQHLNLPHDTTTTSVSVTATEEEEEAKSAPHQQQQQPSDKKYGCIHYERRCVYVSPCCKKIYPCRVCHDEIENHKINRHKVTEIVCLLCDTQQSVSRFCCSCGVEFGRYFCSICRLYDDKDKKQFHCDQCGICRVDGRENFFHCVKCDMCLHKDLKNSHKCVEKAARTDCPVCLEDLHSSRENLSVLKCGHIIHKICFNGLLKSGIYTCPLCCLTMIDMESAWHRLDIEIATTPMPDEYRDVRVTILCRDCHKISRTLFHVVGLKCRKCGSYNTCRESNSSASADDSDDSHGSTSSSPSRTTEHEDQQQQSETTAAAEGVSIGSVLEASSASGSSMPSDDENHFL